MEYLDGEGTAASRAAIEAHLATCAACQAVADEQRTLSDHARAWTVPPAPGSLQPRSDARGAQIWWRPSRVLLAGLSAAAVVLVVVAMNQRSLRLDAPVRTPQAPAKIQASRGMAPPPATMAGQGQRNYESRAAAVDATAPGAATAQGALRLPSIIRTAVLRIVVKDFGPARAAVETLVTQMAGFIDHMTVTGDTSEARTLRGTLRVPSDRMSDALARLRQMGQVVEDTQGSQDVTDQIVDLDARLASARATEQRLTELLRNRTGRLSDVLEVERELTRVRLDIERLDGEKTNIGRRVSYATIDVTITEERKATLDGPLSLATRIRVAAADGLESALESVAATLLFALRAGPTLFFWGAVVASCWLLFRRARGFRIRDSR